MNNYIRIMYSKCKEQNFTVQANFLEEQCETLWNYQPDWLQLSDTKGTQQCQHTNTFYL